MALFDAWATPGGWSFDEATGELREVWQVRAPRGLALQSPNLPAAGDSRSFMGRSLVVPYGGRRISALLRHGQASEADDLTEVEVRYAPAIDTFSGGGLNPDDPNVRQVEGSIEGYDIEIPYHIFEVVTADNGQGGTTTFPVFTPAPAVFESTAEIVTVVMNFETWGIAQREACIAQYGKLHSIDGDPSHPWALFKGVRYQMIGGQLTKVYFTWARVRPLSLDPTPVQFVYKPGDGPDDEAPLPPHAKWAAIPGAETGSGPTLRRGAPTFKVFNRREVGDATLLPGNPVQYIVNGPGNPLGGGA